MHRQKYNDHMYPMYERQEILNMHINCIQIVNIKSKDISVLKSNMSLSISIYILGWHPLEGVAKTRHTHTHTHVCMCTHALSCLPHFWGISVWYITKQINNNNDTVWWRKILWIFRDGIIGLIISCCFFNWIEHCSV